MEEEIEVTADSAETVPEEPAPAEPQGNGILAKVDRYFGITRSGSKFRIEIIAGLTTFMAMVYILMVNANMFSILDGVSYGAVYIATAISAVVGTVLMGLLAKLPLAQASGMGLNAYFVYTVCGIAGISYANALVFVLLDGVIFIVLTATGLRKQLFAAVPDAVKAVIPAGIGLFIAFLGLQNAGIVIPDSSTGVTLASMNFLDSATYGTVIPIAICAVGVVVAAVLAKKNVKGGLLWTMLGAAVLYYALMGLGCAWNDATCVALFESFEMSNPFTAFSDWGTMSVGQVFASGFNFSDYLAIEGNNAGTLILLFITTALAFCMVDMFDTMGTLYGACARGNLLDKNGEVPNMNKAMLCDAIATCTGAICGTSTVTTFVESSSGTGAGGKTGFTAMVTALCFLVAMFLSPIAQLIPNEATAIALIYVGVLMMTCVTKVDWTDPSVAVPAFLTIAIMPLTYSISYGIAAGLISYVLIKVFTGKIKEVKVFTWVIAVLFLLTFFITN
ncbi:MAG: NCS2 family permease [Clostridia bacterium]|nr:NCS2 family permease [Clostridia bacterium]